MFMTPNQGTAADLRSSRFVLSKPLTLVFLEMGTNFVAVDQLTPLSSRVAFFDLGANFCEPHLILILGRRREIHVGILWVSTYRGSGLIVKQVAIIRFARRQPCRDQALGGPA